MCRNWSLATALHFVLPVENFAWNIDSALHLCSAVGKSKKLWNPDLHKITHYCFLGCTVIFATALQCHFLCRVFFATVLTTGPGPDIIFRALTHVLILMQCQKRGKIIGLFVILDKKCWDLKWLNFIADPLQEPAVLDLCYLVNNLLFVSCYEV